MKTFRRGGSPYEILDIGLGRSSNKEALKRLSRYHAFDRIIQLCSACVRQWPFLTPEQQMNYWKGAKPATVDLRKTKMFIADLRLKGGQNDYNIDDLVKSILEDDFEFKWLWWYLDDDHCRVRDYVDHILAI